MDSDDFRWRRRFSRRHMIRLLGLGGSAWLVSGRKAAGAAQSESSGLCVARPRHIEGPFFVDFGLNRSDIRSDPRTGVVKPGTPVRLSFRVSQLNNGRCLPLTGAKVDVWQCDADGLYSDTSDWQASTLGQRFLRGYQLTDRKGLATFTTIYPGWYPNRTVHIHFKIRTENQKEFTSQIYFEDDLTDLIHAQPAYANHGPRKVRNNRDLIFLFRGSGLMLPLREEKKGYAGTFDIALEL
jgi:protocatechuate 3,4-dioxygenase beta subunit